MQNTYQEKLVDMPTIVRTHSGQCTLRFDIGGELEAPFSLVLRSDGSIDVSLNPLSRHQVERIVKANEERRLLFCSLKGLVANPSGEIWIPKLVLTNTRFTFKPQEASVTFSLICASNVEIKHAHLLPQETVEVHYGVTNFDFGACDRQRARDGTITEDFRAYLNDFEITFRQARNYRDTISKLSKNHDVAITCEAIVNTTFARLGELEELLEDTATLLSFATGTYISWVYRDVYSSNALVESHLYANVTGPFIDGKWVIDVRNLGDCYMRTFLETTFPVYNNLKTELGLNLVIGYLVIANQVKYPEAEFLLNSVAAQCLLSHLSTQPATTENASSFKSGMTELLNHFGVVHIESELDFILTRNKIVHTGRFPSGTVPHEATMKLHNLMDRTILTVLGYRGKHYLNQANHCEREVLQ